MYWKAIWLLLGIRGRLTARTMARSSATLAGVILFTLVFGPAAFAAGSACEAKLHVLPLAQQGPFLWIVLLGLQAIWLLILLAGGVGGTGSRLEPKALQAYPLPPRAFVTASAIGSLADIPTLLALPVFMGIYRSVGGNGLPAWTALPSLGLLALHVPAAEQALRYGRDQMRRRPPVFGLLLVGVSLAALGLAAGWGTLAIQSARQGQAGLPILAGGMLVGQVALLIYIADRWLMPDAASTARSAVPHRRRKALAPEFSSPTVSRIAVAAAVEWRNLLQNLAAHLPLRLPAQLVLGIFFGWIAPNLGDNFLLNARDLCGMGSLIYFVVWQVQLITNRWGSEAGTAAMLLGFPIPRTQLLLVRNLTLWLLLAPLDCAFAAVVCLLIHTPGAIPATVGATLIALMLFTAAGNLISALAAFPIARRTEGFFEEPDRSLVFLYAVVGVGAGGAFWADSLLPLFWRVPALALFTAGFYAGSVWLGGKLLEWREKEIIARLDGE